MDGRVYRVGAIAICAGLLVAGCAAGADPGLPLQKVADVRLPGNPTRLDYQSLDARRHLLFIAHLGDGDVIVVNTKARRAAATIRRVGGVHGILVVPELNTVYASATATNEVVAVDERTLLVVARMPGGVYPDGLAFDPISKHIFVSDEHGNTETVIDTRTQRRVATIPLGGQVGNTQYDPVSRHMFANVQTLGRLLEIDPRTNSILRRIALPGCIGNHGLLIDERLRRAFIACEDNAILIWLDLGTMHVMKTWKIGRDPDVMAIDTSTRRLYVAAESGVVSIFADERTVSRLGQAFLANEAHTVAVDSQTHTVYFPLEDVKGRPVLRIMEQR